MSLSPMPPSPISPNPKPPLTRIRRAGIEDAGTIARMAAALAEAEGGPAPHFDALSYRRDGFGPRPQFEVLLAETGGRPAGYALFHPSYDTDRVRSRRLSRRPLCRSLGAGQRARAPAGGQRRPPRRSIGRRGHALDGAAPQRRGSALLCPLCPRGRVAAPLLRRCPGARPPRRRRARCRRPRSARPGPRTLPFWRISSPGSWPLWVRGRRRPWRPRRPALGRPWLRCRSPFPGPHRGSRGRIAGRRLSHGPRGGPRGGLCPVLADLRYRHRRPLTFLSEICSWGGMARPRSGPGPDGGRRPAGHGRRP